MKSLLVYFGFLAFSAPFVSSFYEIKFEALDGALIKTATYQGKKVVVAVVSANKGNVSLLRSLDSLQKTEATLQVIAVPTGDFNGNVSALGLNELKAGLHIDVTKPLKVTRANASLQHPLFVWLTQAKENRHFDMDVEGEGQVFVISSNGTLSALLSKETPIATVLATIKQPISE